ncbi:MAG: hypothetical protein ABI992_04335 [Chthoniobacterales bacterium]
MMRRFVFVLALFASTNLQARIGENPEQIAVRYGPPVAQSFDEDGYGVTLYHFRKLEVARVTFEQGRSRREEFATGSGDPLPLDFIKSLQTENPTNEIFEGDDRIDVDEREVRRSPFEIAGTGAEQVFTGTVEIKERTERKGEEPARYLILRDRDKVLEIGSRYAFFWQDLESGQRYSITVADEISNDIMAPTILVGHREHINFSRDSDDARASRQTLVRITAPGRVIFDRTICEVHHTPMEFRNVEVSYGLLAIGHCAQDFPHSLTFVSGGCLLGEEKKLPIYVCSACVSAAAECKRERKERGEEE